MSEGLGRTARATRKEALKKVVSELWGNARIAARPPQLHQRAQAWQRGKCWKDVFVDTFGEFRGSLLRFRLGVNTPPKVLLLGTKKAYSFAPVRCRDGRFSVCSDVGVHDLSCEDSGIDRETCISRDIRSRSLYFNKVNDVSRVS